MINVDNDIIYDVDNDEDLEILNELEDDFTPSTSKDFTINDLSKKTIKLLTNAGEDLSKLSSDEIEALVGYDELFGHNNILDPYIFLQKYRNKIRKNINESISDTSEQIKAYYDTIVLAREFFDGTQNTRITTLMDQLLSEIEPYISM